MRRLAAAVAIALVAAGCGSSKPSPAPPQGPPTLRNHGNAAARVQQVEAARAGIVAAGGLYAIAHPADARHQLALAGRAYSPMSPLVRATHPVLDREIRAAFATIDELIARGARPAGVELRLGMVQGQLLEAALDATSSRAARSDPTVDAVALDRFVAQLDSSYALSARLGAAPEGRRAFQTAYGLLARSQSLYHSIADALGPQRKRVGNALGGIAKKAFPLGVARPAGRPRPGKVHTRALRVRAALAERFGI
ncbi:MAG: hypothetical protein IRZ21_00135 [Thermoleophilaceae bacterium]|nr:hypothetical protein [Thermoleophilaceae bacterium]